MPNRRLETRSLVKRLRADLREKLGDDAPEVLHLWVEGGLSEGMTMRARFARGAIERVAIGSDPIFNWEAGYQRLLADCVAGWGQASGGDSRDERVDATWKPRPAVTTA
jgi:hypothetical protein